MSNNIDITIHDFKNICRTCLSREDLKPLYEKYSLSTCLSEMLMCCTFNKFAEDDGLPAKICTNCIHEITQAFSFAKRCETTDTILQELVNNSSQSQTDEPIIKLEEEMKIEIKPEVIMPNVHKPVENVLEDYEFVEIKQEENTGVENKYDATYDDPADENYEEGEDPDQDEMSSEAFDTPASIRSQIKDERLQNEENKEKHVNNHTIEEPNVVSDFNAPIQTDHLKNHIGIYTEERPYTCRVCNKAFSRAYNLKYHMRGHTGERPYNCKICNKSFARAYTLKNHMVMHTGEKPYSCEVCNKTFTRPDHRKMHMSIHTKEKSYACDICHKAFTIFPYLKLHMKMHSENKSYNCEICSKVFTQPTYLKRHIRTHNRKKIYSCEVCGKNYTSDKYLAMHKLKLHEVVAQARSQ